MNGGRQSDSPAPSSTPGGTLFAGLLAGLSASACCLGPVVFLALGISGSWIGNLTALEPYRPVFIGLTLLFLGLAFRRLYLAPRECADKAPCATADTLSRQRRIFWIVTGVVGLMVAFPWYGPLFIK